MNPTGAAPEPILIIKKKGGHGGHHGGAWKVAYADFVTAMMALFIVLWLLNTSKQVQEAVGGYFRDPKGYGKQVGTSMASQGENLVLQREDLKKLKERIEAALRQSPDLKNIEKQVEITVTGEGLRVELLESEKGSFFELGRPAPTDAGQALLRQLATEVGRLPNTVAIEGHTDAAPYSSQRLYDNWDLSTERANAARRVMEREGLRPGQIKQLRGFADQMLRDVKDPTATANRRVSVIIQYERQAGTNSPANPSNEPAKPAPSVPHH